MRKSAARALGALALAGAALASTQDGRRPADPSKPAKPEGAAPELTSAPQDPASQENSSVPPRGASNSQLRSQANWVLAEPEIELRTLLELCTSGLGVHLEYDKAKLDGRVSLDRTGEYSPLELWQVFNRELAARSLATVQAPGHSGFKVVPVADAAGSARVESADLRDARAGYLKVVVGLDNRAPEELVETLKQMLSKAGGQINAVREARALVISDYEPHLRQALSVIGLLDLPAAQPVTMEFPLEHASPTTVATLLERLVNTRKAVGAPIKGAALALSDFRDILVIAPASEAAWWRDSIAQLDRPEALVTLHYTPRRFGVAETARLIEATVRPDGAASAGAAWKLVEDRLTGTLVITTTPARHEQVQEVLTRLDETPAGPGKPVRAFSIRNRRVSEVIGVLESLLDAGVLEQPGTAGAGSKAAGANTGANAAAQGATGTIPSSTVAVGAVRQGDAVTLAADEATNRILAFGEASVLDGLERLIEQVDVREAQVLVEALVLSLSDSDSRQLGIELQKTGVRDGVLYSLGSLFGLGSPTPSSPAIPAISAQGGTAVVLSPGDYSAVVRALSNLNRGRSLTSPKVLVNNNVQATLDSTVQTPYASTNASTTVATTSFGGTLDAGTRVTVKPQVADGDQVVMEYTVSLSSFVGEAASAELPPPRQENRLSSVVTVPDGFTIVVGGLEVETEGEASTGVPWVSEIPLLGALFKDQSRTRTKSRFFVFLRCSVMRGAAFEDLAYRSGRTLDAVGLDDGWPELKPRVIR